MKTKLITICLVTAMLLSVPACSSATPKEFSADITSSGRDITMSAGDTLIITLGSNITTGYSWNEKANIDDITVVQQTSHKYQPPAVTIPGAGGNEIWNIKALKAGSSAVSMEYRRPFEPNAAPAKTFTLTVIVQ